MTLKRLVNWFMSFRFIIEKEEDGNYGLGVNVNYSYWTDSLWFYLYLLNYSVMLTNDRDWLLDGGYLVLED